MRKTKFTALAYLGKMKPISIVGFSEFKEEYKKAIEEINERKNNERIKELALIDGESEEVIKAKLEADKDFRNANNLH